MLIVRLITLATAVAASSCVLVADDGEGPSPSDSTNCVCRARNGGETDHVAGDHWFNSGALCGCDVVAGSPETSCRNVCDFRGVRFVDSEGIVCSCTSTNSLACSGDADQSGTCGDADGDGICDGG